MSDVRCAHVGNLLREFINSKNYHAFDVELSSSSKMEWKKIQDFSFYDPLLVRRDFSLRERIMVCVCVCLYDDLISGLIPAFHN